MRQLIFAFCNKLFKVSLFRNNRFYHYLLWTSHIQRPDQTSSCWEGLALYPSCSYKTTPFPFTTGCAGRWGKIAEVFVWLNFRIPLGREKEDEEDRERWNKRGRLEALQPHHFKKLERQVKTSFCLLPTDKTGGSFAPPKPHTVRVEVNSHPGPNESDGPPETHLLCGSMKQTDLEDIRLLASLLFCRTVHILGHTFYIRHPMM